MTGAHPGDLLSALLDGELEAAEAAEVRAHVEVCTGCRTELDDIRAARLSLRSLPAVEPPPELLAFLMHPDVVRPLRSPRRRTVLANVGATAAATVAAVALLGGASGVTAAAVAPEPQGAVEQHDATVSAVSTGGLVHQGSRVTPSTAPPIDELPSTYVAPDELEGYRLAAAYRFAGGVHLLYEKGDHRLSVFEQHGEIGRLPAGGTRVGDAWQWHGGKVVVAERGDVVITVVGDESAEVVLAAARALPEADGGDGGRPLARRAARAFGDVLEALSPAG